MEQSGNQAMESAAQSANQTCEEVQGNFSEICSRVTEGVKKSN